MRLEVDCPLCQQRDYDLLHQTKGGLTSFNRRRAAFYICNHCGVVLRYPQPAALETLHNFYEVEYWQAPQAAQAFQASSGLQRRLEAIFEVIGERWQGATVVDVGCGFGHLTATLAQCLPACQVVGLEPSAQLVEWLKGQKPSDNIEVVAGSLEHFNPPGGQQAQACFLMTVFEHILDPTAALRKLQTLLRTDGWLVLTVPDVMEPGLFGLDYYFRDFHLYYYSEATLSALLRKCGFEVVAVKRGKLFQSVTTPMMCLVARNKATQVAPSLDALLPQQEAARIKQRIQTVAQQTRFSGPLRYLYRYKLRRPVLEWRAALKKRLLGWLAKPAAKEAEKSGLAIANSRK